MPTIINYSFTDVNVTLASTIARLSRAAGVTNLVHVSALAADPFSLSEWARTKSAGEAAVRAAAPGATIVRPADVFGAEDRFLCLVARMYGAFPRVPVVDGGRARVQPLYVDDLAKAIYKIAMVRGGARAAACAPLPSRRQCCPPHSPLPTPTPRLPPARSLSTPR